MRINQKYTYPLGLKILNFVWKSSETIPCETKGINPKNSIIKYNEITLKSMLHVTGTYYRQQIWQRWICNQEENNASPSRLDWFNIPLSCPCARNQNKILHLIWVLTVYTMLKNGVKESIFIVKIPALQFLSKISHDIWWVKVKVFCLLWKR